MCSIGGRPLLGNKSVRGFFLAFPTSTLASCRVRVSRKFLRREQNFRVSFSTASTRPRTKVFSPIPYLLRVGMYVCMYAITKVWAG